MFTICVRSSGNVQAFVLCCIFAEAVIPNALKIGICGSKSCEFPVGLTVVNTVSWLSKRKLIFRSRRPRLKPEIRIKCVPSVLIVCKRVEDETSSETKRPPSNVDSWWRTICSFIRFFFRPVDPLFALWSGASYTWFFFWDRGKNACVNCSNSQYYRQYFDNTDCCDGIDATIKRSRDTLYDLYDTT